MTLKKPSTETVLIDPAENVPAEKAKSPKEERRASRRLRIDRRVLARPSDPKCPEEVQIATNSSRDGVYFKTHLKHYYVGMRLSVILDYNANDPCHASSFGEVARVDKLPDGGFGIAVRIQLR